VPIRNSLKFKVGFYLVMALTLAVFVFALLVVRNNRDVLLQQAVTHNAQLTGVVIKSTRWAMLQNLPSHVDKIIEDVAVQKDIEKVRILSKNGTIIHSSQKDEIGAQVDQEAESCLACHLDPESRDASPMIGRPRFFTDPSGRRMLGSTAVIRNDLTCSSAGCHADATHLSVLGVVDIVSPLGKIDQTLRSNTLTIIGLSVGFIILAGLLVSYLVHRMIYQPLHDLEVGSTRLAGGNLKQTIPVRSDDEFGQLAESFNSMTRALRKSHVDLENWGRTLEQKVEEARHELRIAQAETARSEKLASVGLLAAGIAHELNNPLTGVLTFSYLVRKNMPDGSPEAEDLDLVIKETKRCAAIIRRLLDFAREKKPEKSYSNLNVLIKDTVHLLEQPAQADNIDIKLELDEHLPVVWLDEDLIKQVIMNMMVNAQHAIDGAGSITIKTQFLDSYPGSDPAMRPGSVAEITISDTGCGIPEEFLQRIFDPFFTTKWHDRGPWRCY
jgi:two-component system NtrC family sensor kinase